jgi:hypothetical protein
MLRERVRRQVETGKQTKLKQTKASEPVESRGEEKMKQKFKKITCREQQDSPIPSKSHPLGRALS